MSYMEKVALMYYGKSKMKALERTNYNSAPSILRANTFKNNYERYKQHQKGDELKFKSNNHLFNIKFDTSLPENPLSMKTIYLKRRSQVTAFKSKKISRKDLEKILKWGIFYNKLNNRFTVPCGGGLISL